MYKFCHQFDASEAEVVRRRLESLSGLSLVDTAIGLRILDVCDQAAEDENKAPVLVMNENQLRRFCGLLGFDINEEKKGEFEVTNRLIALDYLVGEEKAKERERGDCILGTFVAQMMTFLSGAKADKERKTHGTDSGS